MYGFRLTKQSSSNTTNIKEKFTKFAPWKHLLELLHGQIFTYYNQSDGSEGAFLEIVRAFRGCLHTLWFQCITDTFYWQINCEIYKFSPSLIYTHTVHLYTCCHESSNTSFHQWTCVLVLTVDISKLKLCKNCCYSQEWYNIYDNRLIFQNIKKAETSFWKINVVMLLLIDNNNTGQKQVY